MKAKLGHIFTEKNKLFPLLSKLTHSYNHIIEYNISYSWLLKMMGARRNILCKLELTKKISSRQILFIGSLCSKDPCVLK